MLLWQTQRQRYVEILNSNFILQAKLCNVDWVMQIGRQLSAFPDQSAAIDQLTMFANTLEAEVNALDLALSEMTGAVQIS